MRLASQPQPLLEDTQSVLDTAHEAFVSMDDTGRIVGWNAAAQTTFGWARDEVLGRPLDQVLIPERLRFAHRQGLARVLNGDSGASAALGRRLELVALHRDGHELPVELTISSMRAQGARVFNAFLRDISERRRTEVELRRLAAIVESSGEAIVSTDLDGRITSWNPAAERLYGYAAADVLGRRISLLVPPDRRAEAERLLADVRAGRPVHELETRRLRADGALLDVALSVAPIRDADGELCGISAVARDVGERKREETRLANQIERLRELSQVSASAPAPTPEVPTPVPGPDSLEAMLRAAREQLGMDIAWVAQVEDETLAFRELEGDRGFLGVERGDTAPLDGTYCKLVVDAQAPQLVVDAREDERTRDMALTRLADVGAYVGVPVRLPDGQLYGTLCCAAHAAHPELDERDTRFLQVLARLAGEQLERERVEADNRQLHAELAAVRALLAALDARDSYTGDHSRSVVELSVAVARRLGLDEAGEAEVHQVALLHDLGKVGIPDAVLQKPGPLDEREWQLMREHPAIGERIVAAVPALAHLAPAVRAEHERWDGGGYPDGLAGEAIPLASRIALACDAWHAMRSDRPYRRAVPIDVALAELRACAGTQFDPAVVAALIAALGTTGE